MFCRNCEKPIFEGDSFCTFCGARATDAADGRTVNRPPIENPGPAPKKTGSKAWIFIVIGVLAAAAVGIGIFFFVRITSYDRPVRALIQGVEKQDGDKLLSAIHPDMLDAMLEEEGISRAEAADQIQSMFGGLGSFGSINIDYEITDVENLSASDVADLEESYQDIGGDGIKVDAAKNLELKVSFMGESNDTELTVFKSGLKWYAAF